MCAQAVVLVLVLVLVLVGDEKASFFVVRYVYMHVVEWSGVNEFLKKKVSLEITVMSSSSLHSQGGIRIFRGFT
jgi:hypothetical protein